MSKELSVMRKAFADEYIKNGGNSTQAAIAAGYSKKTAYSQGQRLLKVVEVSEYIACRMECIEKKEHRDIMSLADIQERRSKIARGEVVDGLGFAPDFSDQLKAMDGLEKTLTIVEKKKTGTRGKATTRKSTIMDYAYNRYNLGFC